MSVTHAPRVFVWSSRSRRGVSRCSPRPESSLVAPVEEGTLPSDPYRGPACDGMVHGIGDGHGGLLLPSEGAEGQSLIVKQASHSECLDRALVQWRLLSQSPGPVAPSHRPPVKGQPYSPSVVCGVRVRAHGLYHTRVQDLYHARGSATGCFFAPSSCLLTDVYSLWIPSSCQGHENHPFITHAIIHPALCALAHV
jgi:hypothetical protein